jgi:hypothetical protein
VRRWRHTGQANAYASAVLQDNPVLYLRLEETSGTTCADSSTDAFTGTATATVVRNVTSHAGIGVGAQWGVATDHIDVPDNNALDVTGDVTYEFWINYSSRAAAQMIMGKGFQDASNAGYQLWIDSGGLMQFERSSLVSLSHSAAVPNDSAWHHCVFTRVGNLFASYIDTVAGGTSTLAQAVQATANPFMVGAAFYNSVGSRFNGLIAGGKIDEVAVYNTGLSSARVAAHFAAAV